MRSILVVAALITVLTGCGDVSPFGNQRYQIVKGTHQDYLLDTKTGRTWYLQYNDSMVTYEWLAIKVAEQDELLNSMEDNGLYRVAP